jgi:hypothetical protein
MLSVGGEEQIFWLRLFLLPSEMTVAPFMDL